MSDGPDDHIAERILRQDEFASDLTAQGYPSGLVLPRENGRDVLTESRLELVRYLDRHGDDVESVRDLARKLDRDKVRSARTSVDSPSSTSSSTRALVTVK